MADSLQSGNTALTEQLLNAIERCRDAHREFLGILKQLHPATTAGEQARMHLEQQLSEMDCGDDLLRHMLDGGQPIHSEIHTATPPDQLQ